MCDVSGTSGRRRGALNSGRREGEEGRPPSLLPELWNSGNLSSALSALQPSQATRSLSDAL